MRALGKVDRYVGRLFAMSYVTAFLLVVGLFLILDMATNLDEYLRPDEQGQTPSMLLIARYYALHTPFLYLQMSPFVTLVAGMFATARLARSNEVVAVLNAGVSSRRMLAPMLLGALLLAAGMFALREWVTAELGEARDVLQDRLVERRERPVYDYVWIRDPSGRQARFSEYEPAVRPGESALFRELFCAFRQGRETVFLQAAAGEWDAGRGEWRLTDGRRLIVSERSQENRSIDVLTDLVFTPEDVELAYRGRERPEGLGIADLRRLLVRDPHNISYRTLLHANLTYPLAGLVLLFVGLPFLVGQERGRAAERIALGFFLCLTYFAVDFVARTLGIQGELGPLHAGWLPVVLFGSLGGALFASMRS